MNKAELANYLVSLHTLLDAQSKGAHSIPSATLAEEYERTWGQFKELIAKDRNDERRTDHG
jgi:hypothetical protein